VKIFLPFEGLSVPMPGKSSADGNVPNFHPASVWEAGNTDLSNVFQICSSNAFWP
jgi:hypothetical protein